MPNSGGCWKEFQHKVAITGSYLETASSRDNTNNETCSIFHNKTTLKHALSLSSSSNIKTIPYPIAAEATVYHTITLPLLCVLQCAH